MSGPVPQVENFAGHESRQARLAQLVRPEFAVDHYIFENPRKPSSLLTIDFSGLPALLRLELQYATQARHDGRQTRVTASMQPVVRCIARRTAKGGVLSLVDRELSYWELQLHTDNPGWSATSGTAALAVLRAAYRLVSDLYDERDEFDKDLWDLRKLGHGPDYDRGAWSPWLDFRSIMPTWLAELVRRWLRHRVQIGSSPSTLGENLGHLKAFAAFLHERAPECPGPAGLTRLQVIEPYVAHVDRLSLAEFTQHKLLFNLRLFLEDCGRHGWAELAPAARVYSEDMPKGRCRVPRFLEERVMAQLAANLDKFPNTSSRHITVLLMETGRRLGEIVNLAFGCVVHDGDGQPYLHYYQSKLSKEHVIPLNGRAGDVIAAQQARVLARWPGGSPYLFPRERWNPHGTLPFVQATFRDHLSAWVAACDIRDGAGQPLSITSHQFRHTLATRMVNMGVRQEIVQRYLGHESPEMTARYAAIHDRTVKDEFLRFERQRFDCQGEPVRFVDNGISGEERWLKVNLKAQALPNGYCGLPLQMQCPHANACHTCSHFQTDVTFLPVHKRQFEATRTIIEEAKSRGHNRQVEMNVQVATNLERLVASLERQAGQV